MRVIFTRDFAGLHGVSPGAGVRAFLSGISREKGGKRRWRAHDLREFLRL